ncbi:hypothetical protein A9995_10510 [Erythrobacter sp. QSSC1-22B]|nr:hypothetical protein A9995_10510 [Erythrobacter sp. QSSC1-22B]
MAHPARGINPPALGFDYLAQGGCANRLLASKSSSFEQKSCLPTYTRICVETDDFGDFSLKSIDDLGNLPGLGTRRAYPHPKRIKIRFFPPLRGKSIEPAWALSESSDCLIRR